MIFFHFDAFLSHLQLGSITFNICARDSSLAQNLLDTLDNLFQIAPLPVDSGDTHVSDSKVFANNGLMQASGHNDVSPEFDIRNG